jgi:hypothetical protein
MLEEAERAVEEEQQAKPTLRLSDVLAEESEESKKKTYMIKDEQGKMQIKSKE